MIKDLICFLFGGAFALFMKFVFAMLGFNPDGWYCGWFSCFFVCLFAIYINYKEEE